MKNRQIIEKLQNLQSLRVGGDANPVWQREVRDSLIRTASRDLESAPAVGRLWGQFSFAKILMPYRLSHYVLRPVLVSGLVLSVAFGGWVTTVSASYKSLPGDVLYGVKIAAEEAQVKLAGDSQSKVELKVEFAGRRVTEVNKLIERPAPAAEKAANVKVAVNKMKDDLASVQKEMTNIKDNDPSKMKEVAKFVDQKTEALHATLEKTAQNAPGDIQNAVKEAKDATADTGVAAMSAIVDAQKNSGSAISVSDAKESVSDKITSLQEKVGLVEKSADGSVTDKTAQAKVALGEAQQLLNADNIDGAVAKVIEGNDITKLAEAFVVATKESAPPAPIVTATSTPPVLPVTTSTPPLPASSITSTPRTNP